MKSSPSPSVLDQKFWSHFAKNIWEKKTLVLKNVKSPLLEMNEAEIFKLLVLYSHRCRQLKDASGFKFYISGIQAHPEDVLQILPLKKDKNLLGYHARMQALFEDYCLVCDELLQVNAEKQALLVDFTSELYRHVGFPNRFSEMGLYLGNYRKTPFGVHVDSCGVFSFPVVGNKKFRIWTSAFAKKNPKLDRAFEYPKFKKDSLVLEASAGDLTYWPSSAWHIAEGDGSFSATWSLGVWLDKTHAEFFGDVLNKLVQKKLGSKGQKLTTMLNKDPQSLPMSFKDSIDLLAKLSSKELEKNFQAEWKKHRGLKGFKKI
jgi:hypothetical protein